MKFFFAIFTIILMIQASMAGSLGRSKRSDEDAMATIDMVKLGKKLVDTALRISTGIVNDMPKTDEYDVYHTDFQNFLTSVNEIDATADNCATKTVLSLVAMYELFVKYNEGDFERTEEYLEVEKLYNKYGGEEFEKDAVEFKDKYLNDSFEEKLVIIKKGGTDLGDLAEMKCKVI